MNKRMENLGGFLISVLVVILLYGPIIALYLIEVHLGIGFILGMFWIVGLFLVAVWLHDDPDEEIEEENGNLTAE